MLRFSSDAFAVTPGEDQETNPGIFGTAPATWVSEQLIRAGFKAGDRSAELVADLHTTLRHCLESSPVVYGLAE
jgi:hypothetical protein